MFFQKSAALVALTAFAWQVAMALPHPQGVGLAGDLGQAAGNVGDAVGNAGDAVGDLGVILASIGK